MKIYYLKLISIILLTVTVTVACESDKEFGIDESAPAVNFRMVPSTSAFDIAAGDPAIGLTLYSENTDIQKVVVQIELFQVASGSTTSRELLTEINGSSIKNDGSSKLSFKLSDFAVAVGLSLDDIGAGDFFTIYNFVHLNDGRVYPSVVKLGDKEFVNIENGILGAATTSSFTSKLVFSVMCPQNLPLDVNLFVGDYIANEPGYGEYDVTFTLLSASPPRVQIDNFWDFGGTPYYEFDTDPSTDAVSLPKQDVVMGGITFVVEGSGTVNKCTGQMIVNYTVRRKSDNALFDDNTHTFSKKQ